MKLKQILSGFMAVAMAVTSSVVMTATVNAEDNVMDYYVPGIYSTITSVGGVSTSFEVDATYYMTSAEANSVAKIRLNFNKNNDGYAKYSVSYSDAAGGWVAGTDTEITSNTGDFSVEETITGGLSGYVQVGLGWINGGVTLQTKSIEFLDSSDNVIATAKNVDDVTQPYTLWSGSQEFPSDWSANIQIPTVKLRAFPKGTIEVSVSDVSNAQGIFKYINSNHEWLDLSEGIQIADTDTKFSFDISNDALDTLFSGRQLVIGGCGFTVTEVTYIPQAANTITIDENIENGDVSVSAEEAVEGTEITLTATPDEGYELDAYTVTDASDNTVTVTDGKFTMPDSAVTVSATFKAIDYTLTAATADGGSIYFEVDGNRAETANVGDDVYVIIDADDYYNLSSVTANGVPVEDCLFEMPAENVTVTPVFALDTEALKTDVDAALVTVISSTQSSAYTVANLNTAIVNALAEINEAVALTVDTSKLTLKASTEEATGSITGTVTIKAGNTTITTAAADVTLEKVPTDPVQVAYDAIIAYLETVTFDNDFHATNQSKAIEALVAEKAPDARVSPSFTVILATYTNAGSVKGTIQIIADGYELKTITVDEVIAVLAKTDEMLLEEAVTATEAAIKDITTADGITVAVIEEAIANDDITVTVKSEETKAPTTTATGVQTVTITLTLNELSKTVTKTFDIDKLEEEESIVLWSGSTDLGTDWGTSITVTFDTSKLNAGDTVKVTYKAGTAATYQQIKLMNGDWTVLESPTGKNEWDCVDLSASATTYEFVISEADVKLLNGTMIVSGYNATISSVEVIPAKNETSSSYTDPENTDIPTGKTVTQKTVVEDGIYNQRFIKKVSASDLVGATKIVFTVSNGTKTAKYESTKCYSSLNVNGDSLSAGDDNVFLGLTIKGIPENITVTIVGIEIV